MGWPNETPNSFPGGYHASSCRKSGTAISILRILSAKGTRLLLCAPTGRAAKRMNEATGFEAKTIHRLLEVDPRTGGFRRDSQYPLDCDLLVIDETSMVDVMLMHALLKAMPNTTVLLVVGDVDQLPSVGPGQVLADMIASGVLPVVRLRDVQCSSNGTVGRPAVLICAKK